MKKKYRVVPGCLSGPHYELQQHVGWGSIWPFGYWTHIKFYPFTEIGLNSAVEQMVELHAQHALGRID